MRNPATGVRGRYVRVVAENLHRTAGCNALDISFQAGDLAKLEDLLSQRGSPQSLGSRTVIGCRKSPYVVTKCVLQLESCR